MLETWLAKVEPERVLETWLAKTGALPLCLNRVIEGVREMRVRDNSKYPINKISLCAEFFKVQESMFMFVFNFKKYFFMP